MTTYRSPKHHGHYVRIDTAVIFDKRLSPDARLLMCYLLALPDDWQINPAHLRAELAWGRDKWRRVLGELERAGHITRHALRTSGHITATRYDVHEAPCQPGLTPEKPVPGPAFQGLEPGFQGLEPDFQGLAPAFQAQEPEKPPLTKESLRSTTTSGQAVASGKGLKTQGPATPRVTPEASPQVVQPVARTGCRGSAPEPRPAPTQHPPGKQGATALPREHGTIPARWSPDPAVLEQLASLGIDRAFALAALPEFVRYWTDAGATCASWNAKYLRHIQHQWARDRQHRRQAASTAAAAQPGFIEKHTDPTWRNGL